MGKKLKLALISSSVVLSACGGGGIGSDSSSSLYNLLLKVDTSFIESAAVKLSQQNVEGQEGALTIDIPRDRIKGSVELKYNGQMQDSKQMRGTIKEAELCILDKCGKIPINGILYAGGGKIGFDLNLNFYKTELPWIAINPVEDKIISVQMVEKALSGPGESTTQNDTYLNTQRSINLQSVPVSKNSVLISYNGEFEGSQTVQNYSSGQKIVLDKGITSSNSIKPGSVVVSAGNLSCRDDSSGNLTSGCTGTVNYATGEVQINGVSNVAVSVNYKVNGVLRCYDDGAGKFVGDCVSESSINYATGQLNYKFKFNVSSIPATVNIAYSQATASSNKITYNLPASQPAGSYTYKSYGRVIEVYQGNVKLCDNISASSTCSIEKKDNTATITFASSVPGGLTIKYSEDVKVDINPGVDATRYAGQFNGTTSPTVNGKIRVKVKLDDSSTLTAEAPITFVIRPSITEVVDTNNSNTPATP